MATQRQKDIRRRRQRKQRIGKLKTQLAEAKTLRERQRLIALIQKRVPGFEPSGE